MNCILCDMEAQTLPPNGLYYHLKCKNCGEYKITIPATVSLDDNKKVILAGKTFFSWYYNNKVIQITTQEITEAKKNKKKYSFLINCIYSLNIYIQKQKKIE